MASHRHPHVAILKVLVVEFVALLWYFHISCFRLSGGSVFCIIFIVVLVLYCAVGIGYNIKLKVDIVGVAVTYFFSKGATGADSVPNIHFWYLLTNSCVISQLLFLWRV